MMKKTTALFSIILFSALSLSAQTFEEGAELYENGNFEEAYSVFSEIDSEEAWLFSGKSLFALNRYLTANTYLRKAEASEDRNIRQEALYSQALSHFRMKNYARSLDLLYELITEESRTGIQIDARRFYRQVMNFLSLEQRFTVLQHTQFRQVAEDIVESSRTRVDNNTYKVLVRKLSETEPDSAARAQLSERYLTESDLQPVHSPYPAAPQGIVYNIGVILPTFNEQSPEFYIPRNIYFGITLAAEEFNSRNADKKVNIHFKSSGTNADTTAAAFTELVWNRHVDAVIGPLFSEPAERMAKLAEEFRIPMIAPLANADNINIDYNYTFQLNPTFEVHGKNMARYAVQELGLDSLAVITQKNALGTSSALGFRYEAERLGAHISYYFEEDFAALGYDITDYTEVFTSDSTLADSLGYHTTHGIYAPFTGRAANTLINLLMTDLEVMSSDVVVFGSEEWEGASLTGWQRRNIEIYYSQAFGAAADSATIAFINEDFESRFGIEADQFAKIGFDAANYLFQSLETAGNPVYLKNVMKQAPRYNGLGLRVDFDDHRVNQHVYIRPLSDPAIRRVEDSSRLRRHSQ